MTRVALLALGVAVGFVLAVAARAPKPTFPERLDTALQSGDWDEADKLFGQMIKQGLHAFAE